MENCSVLHGEPASAHQANPAKEQPPQRSQLPECSNYPYSPKPLRMILQTEKPQRGPMASNYLEQQPNIQRVEAPLQDQDQELAVSRELDPILRGNP